MLVILVLPMFNEEQSIPLLAESTRTLQSVDVILAVNDGSTDSTLGKLKRWQTIEPRLKILSYTPNQGLPKALTAGFRKALEMDVDVIVTMDSDATHSTELIAAMVRKIREGSDIVIASRHVLGSSETGLSAVRKLLSWGASRLMRLFFSIKGLRDYSTNYRAYRASLVREALARSGGRLVTADDFSGVVELLLRLCSLSPRISEVPLELHYEAKLSSSKVRIMKTILGYLRLIAQPKVVSRAGVCLPLLTDNRNTR